MPQGSRNCSPGFPRLNTSIDPNRSTLLSTFYIEILTINLLGEKEVYCLKNLNSFNLVLLFYSETKNLKDVSDLPMFNT